MGEALSLSDEKELEDALKTLQVPGFEGGIGVRGVGLRIYFRWDPSFNRKYCSYTLSFFDVVNGVVFVVVKPFGERRRIYRIVWLFSWGSREMSHCELDMLPRFVLASKRIRPTT